MSEPYKTNENTKSFNKEVFSYIKTNETSWRTERVPLTNSKSWNMYEHIERCTNVSNAWFHKGSNEDGLRPYDDIVTPIINVAFRSEGFDVKDIIPFVEDVDEAYKSFIIKKYQPKWARKYELDTFIDEVVESSIIYDLVLVKNVNDRRPEVVDLKTIAFCDQTDIMAGPICLKHQLTPAEISKFKGKWDDEAIDIAITLSKSAKVSNTDSKQEVKTPGKYIQVYELKGDLPESWIIEDGDPNHYVPQTHIVCFYTDKDSNKEGITLYCGPDKPLSDNFKALKIDGVRSKGRACGRSIVETLFEPQVWNNYSAIKIKKLLDAAITLWQSSDPEIAGQKLNDLANNTVVKHSPDKPLSRVDGNIQNLTAFTNYQVKQENSARILGSASDAQLGTNPVSGTPFALQNLVVQQGQGMHEYRQGKIATFFADVLYRDWILKWMIDDLNDGKIFSEEISLDELQEIVDIIAMNRVDEKIKNHILETGNVPTQQEREELTKLYKDNFMKSGSRKFFETVKGELKNIPVSVMVNIKGKQRYMAQNADKITNIIREIIKNPQAFAQIPGLGKVFNQLLEESGMSSINFTQIITPEPVQQLSEAQSVQTPPVAGEQL